MAALGRFIRIGIILLILKQNRHQYETDWRSQLHNNKDHDRDN